MHPFRRQLLYSEQNMKSKPRHTTQAHSQDGVPPELAQRKERNCKTADADPIYIPKCFCITSEYYHGQDGKPCPKNQCYNDRAQAGKNALQQRNILVFAVDV